MIKRQPGRALFRLVADELRAQITSGQLAVGDEMPSRDALMRIYGIGKETATKALALLKADGLIETEHGRRARVRVQPERRIIKVQRGSRWFSRPATAADHKLLTLGETERVVELVYGAKVTLYPADSTEFHTS